jgi:hypothetical protein
MRYPTEGGTSHSSSGVQRRDKRYATGLSLGSWLIATERYVPIMDR